MTHRFFLNSIILPAIVLLSALITACGSGENSPATTPLQEAPTEHRLPDTLRVATIYGPGSYFLYRGEKLGYDYELVKRLCDDKRMTLDLSVAQSLNDALAMLDSGKVDLVACDLPINSETKRRFIPAGFENLTEQVLVQNTSRPITDIEMLRGKRVTVERDSKHHIFLDSLNRRLGGEIIINTVSPDSLPASNLVEMVESGEIDFTIIDSDLAAINRTFTPDIDISLSLGSPSRSAWGVAPDNKWLADSIDAWAHSIRPRQEQALLVQRYYQRALRDPQSDPLSRAKSRTLSPYDDLFRKYAKEIDWDWRLLAAQAYTESNYRPTAVSWAGARGLMQIMPSTGRGYGVNPRQLSDPETSVKTAVKVIADLDKWLTKKIPDRVERQKFILAAYNGGVAHIYDAIALAEKYGMDPSKWNNNVEKAILMKSNRRYYKDPVVKYGYSRGSETHNYVRRIYDYYEKAKRKVPA